MRLLFLIAVGLTPPNFAFAKSWSFDTTLDTSVPLSQCIEAAKNGVEVDHFVGQVQNRQTYLIEHPTIGPRLYELVTNKVDQEITLTCFVHY